MFGTMATLRPKPGCEDAIRAYLTGEGAERSRAIDGYVTEYLLEPSDPGADWIALIVFESEEKYRQNAADPAQHEAYLALLEHVIAPPTWHDGQIQHLEPSSVAI